MNPNPLAHCPEHDNNRLRETSVQRELPARGTVGGVPKKVAIRIMEWIRPSYVQQRVVFSTPSPAAPGRPRRYPLGIVLSSSRSPALKIHRARIGSGARDRPEQWAPVFILPGLIIIARSTVGGPRGPLKGTRGRGGGEKECGCRACTRDAATVAGASVYVANVNDD